MCISTESWALWELVLPSCDQGHISVPREAWMTQLHVTLWPTEGAVSPLKLKKKILESCNFYREGYHANRSLCAQQG